MKRNGLSRFFRVLMCAFSILLFCQCVLADVLVLPESVNAIEEEAFYGDTSLDQVILSDTMESIGEKAFANSSIKRIYLPETIKSIHPTAFDGCELVVGWGPEDTFASHFFEEYSNLVFERPTPVTDFTFSDNKDGTCTVTGYTGKNMNVVIPMKNADGLPVTRIGPNAFKKSQIISVVMPDTVLEIGYEAFSGCTYLNSVVLSNNLISLTPYSGTNGRIFYGCTSLTRIDIPSSVSDLGKSTFDGCTSLSTVVLHEGLSSIGERALYNCKALTEITLPSTLISIGDYAFSNCSSLTTIDIQDGLTSIGKSAFSGCKNIGTVTLPTSMQSIGENAFYNCGLTEVSIPDTVVAVGKSAFTDCDRLTYITLPQSVKSMGDNAFSNCDSLVGIVLPDGLTTIGAKAFEGCDVLADITIPNSVTAIGNAAFKDCKKLTEVKLSNEITTITDEMFRNCTSLTKALLPDSITSIGQRAFSNCTALTRVVLSDNLLTVSDYAFESCKALSDIAFSSRISSLGKYAFSGCQALGTANLPDSITAIGEHCFDNCTALTSIKWSSATETINAYMFDNCKSLNNIMFDGNITSVGDHSFNRCINLASMNLPNSLVTISNCAFYASGLTSIVIPENVTTIGNSAFNNCDKLVSIKIPNSVLSIGESAFRECDLLSVIGLPNSLSTIPNNLFHSCDNLTRIIIPSSILSIGESGFYGCKSLTSLIVPAGVQSIGKNAFSGCTNFTSIIIPPSVISIGNGAFTNCKKLVIYGGAGSEAEKAAEKYTYVAFSTDTPDKTEPDNSLIGFFTKQEVVMNINETIRISGEVISTGANIDRITLTIDGYYVEDDDNDRYVTKVFSDMQSISLDDHEEFCLDGTKEPLNSPGKYTINLWASTTEWEGVKLASMTVTVVEPDDNIDIIYNNKTVKDKYLYASAGKKQFTIECSKEIVLAEAYVDGVKIESNLTDHTLSFNLAEGIHSITFVINETRIEAHFAVFTSVDNIDLKVATENAGFYSWPQSGYISKTLSKDTSINVRGTINDIYYYVVVNDEEGFILAEDAFSTEADIPVSFQFVHMDINMVSDQDIYKMELGTETLKRNLVLVGEATPGAKYTYQVISTQPWVMTHTGDWFNHDQVSIEGTAGTSFVEIVFSDSVTDDACQGSLAFTFNDGKEITITVVKPEYTNFDKAFKKASTSFDEDLAKVSVRMANTVYKDVSQTYDRLAELGFEFPMNYSIISQEHTVGHIIARKAVMDQDGDIVNLFAVIIRGTNSTAKEWKSNFTAGTENHHYGFNQAAKEVMDNLTAYMSSFNENITNDKYIVWICGHSRGAAVGNLIAGYYLNDRPRQNVFAYLFATPNVSKSASENASNANIKNFVIGGDLVPRVPLVSWGYGKYGVTYTLEDEEAKDIGLNVLKKQQASDWMGSIGTLFTEVSQIEAAKDLIADGGGLELDVGAAGKALLQIACEYTADHLVTSVLPTPLQAIIAGCEAAPNITKLAIIMYQWDETRNLVKAVLPKEKFVNMFQISPSLAIYQYLTDDYEMLTELGQQIYNSHDPANYVTWIEKKPPRLY